MRVQGTRGALGRDPMENGMEGGKTKQERREGESGVGGSGSEEDSRGDQPFMD